MAFFVTHEFSFRHDHIQSRNFGDNLQVWDGA